MTLPGANCNAARDATGPRGVGVLVAPAPWGGGPGAARAERTGKGRP